MGLLILELHTGKESELSQGPNLIWLQFPTINSASLLTSMGQAGTIMQQIFLSQSIQMARLFTIT